LAADLKQSLSLIARYVEQASHQLDQADCDRRELRAALQLIHQEALGSKAILARLLSLAPEAPAVIVEPLMEGSELTVRVRVDALPDGGTIDLRAWCEAQTVELEVEVIDEYGSTLPIDSAPGGGPAVRLSFLLP
jgi:hypothetical protein